MRKKWQLIGIGLAVAVLAVAATACDDCPETVLVGSGNVLTEEETFDGFSSVEAHHAFELDIVQSDDFSVIVRADDDILGLVDVSKSGDTLILDLERSVSLSGDTTLEASITMPELSELSLTGASRATLTGFRSSGDLRLDLSGASAVEGDLEAGEIDIDLSGASHVTLEGAADGAVIRGSGASRLDLADFTVDTADVTLSGASEATVHVEERIDSVDLSGASRLRYRGDPSLGDVDTSGASSLDNLED